MISAYAEVQDRVSALCKGAGKPITGDESARVAQFCLTPAWTSLPADPGEAARELFWLLRGR